MENETIGILKMPMGNLRSVWNSLYEQGIDPVFVDENDDFDNLTHLIVPGVGHFKTLMQHLQNKGLDSKIQDFAKSGRPTLGICVGMQAFAKTGSEGSETNGLGLVNATVTKLPNSKELRLPHVGWDSVKFRHKHPVFEGIKEGRDFYFVHSFAMEANDESQWLGETSYGRPFASIIGEDNVIGFQFHPEKSQANGLKLLENFCYWDGLC